MMLNEHIDIYWKKEIDPVFEALPSRHRQNKRHLKVVGLLLDRVSLSSYYLNLIRESRLGVTTRYTET